MTGLLLNVNMKNVNNYYVSDDKTSPQCQHEECKQLPCLR